MRRIQQKEISHARYEFRTAYSSRGNTVVLLPTRLLLAGYRRVCGSASGYILLKGTISEYTLSVVLYDPIVVLLLLFISGSALGMLINWWARREIIVGPDFISFKNRIRERKFTARDILKIHVGNEHDMPVRGRFKTIKIRTTHRRRPLRIRPGSYSDERGLTQAILRLKRNLPARHR